MKFDQFSSPNGGGCDIETIRQFWVGALQRLKVYAEFGELEAMFASGTDPGSTRPVDSNETQTGPGPPTAKINSLHKDKRD